MRKLLRIIAAVGCINILVAPATPAVASAAVSQCRTSDRAIPKVIRFARGRTTAVIKDTIRLCTSHEYRFRAREGQTMTVHLATGKRTSFTLQAPSGDTIEGADGVKDWSGDLPQTGEYVISVGTDATAAYTLEVTIR